MIKIYKNGVHINIEDIKASFDQCREMVVGMNWSGQIGGRYEISYRGYILDYRIVLSVKEDLTNSVSIDLLPTDRNVNVMDEVSKGLNETDRSVLLDIHVNLSNYLNTK